MELLDNGTYINKTYKYLMPSLRGYGDDFVLNFNIFWKMAVGIHDITLNGSNLNQGKNIIVMFNKNYKPEITNTALVNLRKHPSYVTDYSYEADFINSNRHMLVIEIPERFHKAYDSFIKGKYSEMYNSEELKLLFSVSKDKERNVLLKNSDYKQKYINTINETFGTLMTVEDFDDIELDLPLVNVEEIFNWPESDKKYFNRGRDIT
jgi:hypothetical protein